MEESNERIGLNCNMKYIEGEMPEIECKTKHNKLYILIRTTSHRFGFESSLK